MSAPTAQSVKELIAAKPIFVAAKSYCPYCQASKSTLFKELNVPADKATVLDLDQMQDGQAIQAILAELTQQNTVPNIFINGKHIGGNSDLQALKNNGELQKLVAAL
ncbi:hypothetical protein TPHA_0B03560 [Tetrapisispora phaffii CBS 4417]|uniref:Glutaredoxin domain-containing protein n=1 Tax=Tetrapisispora phaffii (strain ATCC 24235 / CBS 4417 / NBRC 1672 / NRRL Y-8282 / UCD 70-5) TaxID=1071381 RepID=G8BPU5_TETPH|nr:hypothetical protein TPHA_0B03560 [Tetrapisispora phaffii CBS 4417]CCE62026.1 hypothetical protein TPHA_0B03560 [Tetrapisispora phaffii CBS 4417]